MRAIALASSEGGCAAGNVAAMAISWRSTSPSGSVDSAARATPAAGRLSWNVSTAFDQPTAAVLISLGDAVATEKFCSYTIEVQ